MERYRFKERFEGVRWLGAEDTPQEDIEWLRNLPSGDNNVVDVTMHADTVDIGTRLSIRTASVGDYVLMSDDKGFPVVLPKWAFDMSYEVCD